MAGTVRETYAAALQHDLVELSGEELLAGVVRRPTGWFRGAVDENYRELAPPDDLIEEMQETKEDLELQGVCAEGAHNAAWDEVEFADRYRSYLDESTEVPDAIEDLLSRIRRGEDVVLVCFEGDNKRCHRHILKNRIEERLSASTGS